MRFQRSLTIALIGLILLGSIVRFVNLNHKVYWHDEVYTSIRASGYTRREIDEALFQNQEVPAIALQTYQQIKPGSTAIDTMRSLALEEPQHPPLYFLMTRFWMQIASEPLIYFFHSPLTVMRSLPALLSLLALPAMYGLAWELFASHPIALVATTLLALSPYDVLFAQTARQDSLLTVMVIVSSFLLLRTIRVFQAAASSSATAQRNATRHPTTWSNWGLYALALTIGLYTQPLFGLTLAFQVVYVGARCIWDRQFNRYRQLTLKFFVGAILISLIIFSPWLIVMLRNVELVILTTNLAQINLEISDLLKLWTLSFTSLFLDINFGLNHLLTYLLRLPFLILIGASLIIVYRRTAFPIWLFITLSIAVPFLLLALAGLILGGKWSAVSHYLTPCYPGVQLAVAYFLAAHLATQRFYSGRSRSLIQTRTAYTLRPDLHRIRQTWFCRSVLVGVIFASITSLTVSTFSNSWWNKGVSVANDQTADLLNKIVSPLIVSDHGDYTNTGDLISLSYRLNNNVPFLLLQSSTFVNTPEFESKLQGKTPVVFRPSPSLQQALTQKYAPLLPLLQAERLWKLSVTSVESIKTSESIETSQKNKKNR